MRSWWIGFNEKEFKITKLPWKNGEHICALSVYLLKKSEKYNWKQALRLSALLEISRFVASILLLILFSIVSYFIGSAGNMSIGSNPFEVFICAVCITSICNWIGNRINDILSLHLPGWATMKITNQMKLICSDIKTIHNIMKGKYSV